MYIDRISIENVRGFGDECPFLHLDRGAGRFAGWTVVAGRNGSGKTALLRAIALTVLSRPMAAWLQLDLSDWVRVGWDEARVSLGLQMHSEDSFASKGRRPARVDLNRTWTRSPQDPARMLGVERAGSSTRGEDRSAGPWVDGATGWFLAGYGPFRRLTGHAADAQRAMSGPAPVARAVTLFREDASLLESLQWLRDLHLRGLEGDDDAQTLRDITLALLEDGLLPDPELRVDRYDADGLWVKRGPDGAPLRLTSLSDGYRAVTALVLDLLRGLVQTFGTSGIEVRKGKRGEAQRVVVRCRGVVLIDEVDTHLHVSWQRRVGPWLKAHFPAVQFIVSTHSPFVCQSADERGLILLPEPGAAGAPRVADDELRRRVVNGSADDALLSELFGMEHTWSDEAEQKRADLASLEVRVLTGAASKSDRRAYERLLEEIPQSLSDEVDRAARAALSPAGRRAR